MLCQTAIVYSRTIDGKAYSFGHEGILYRQSFIMYDKQTGSLWVHTTGEAVKGPLKGKVLTFLPSVVTTWKRWHALHPETRVLTGRRGAEQMGRFGLQEEPGKYGLSVGQGKTPKLYPFESLMASRVVNDVHAGRPIVVLYDVQGRSASAYERGERTFAWKDGRLVDDTGAEWDPLRAMPVEGGKRLEQVPATTWLISRWKGFHPRAPVHGAK